MAVKHLNILNWAVLLQESLAWATDLIVPRSSLWVCLRLREQDGFVGWGWGEAERLLQGLLPTGFACHPAARHLQMLFKQLHRALRGRGWRVVVSRLTFCMFSLCGFPNTL